MNAVIGWVVIGLTAWLVYRAARKWRREWRQGLTVATAAAESAAAAVAHADAGGVHLHIHARGVGAGGLDHDERGAYDHDRGTYNNLDRSIDHHDLDHPTYYDVDVDHHDDDAASPELGRAVRRLLELLPDHGAGPLPAPGRGGHRALPARAVRRGGGDAVGGGLSDAS